MCNKAHEDYEKFTLKNCFHGGGGSTTCNELDNLLSQKNNYIFCFLDSDKESPSCLYTDTAKKCINSLKKNSWIGMFGSTNNFREAENIIPLSLLEKIEGFPFANIRRIKEIEEKHQVNFYEYVDIKYGLTNKFLKKVTSTNSPKKAYWIEVIKILSAEEDVSLDCNLVEGECNVHTQLEGKVCQILPLGTKKTLDNTINLLDKISVNESYDIIKDDPSNKAWLDIGETTFWLSCSLPRIRLS